ncbi:MAG TPA: hypothetical protein VEP73_11715 [Actinomycetota bacterium]|nr:hypothetical protein [Actinomycetota bacterium]
MFDPIRMDAARRAVARDEERTRLANLVGPTALAADQLLPVLPPLARLLPHGGLRRGTVVTIDGSLRLALALAASVTQADRWAAAVGIPELGVVAAAEIGVVLRRFPLVPDPDRRWAQVVAALLHAVDLVVARVPATGSPASCRQLATRVRERGSVLLALGAWPAPDLVLSVSGETWTGLEAGAGRLTQRRVRVVATGRGAAALPREAWLWLPFRDGTVQPAD